MEHRIVTRIAIIVDTSFALNVVYYSELSEGTWKTFMRYDKFFEFVLSIVLQFLDTIFQK